VVPRIPIVPTGNLIDMFSGVPAAMLPVTKRIVPLAMLATREPSPVFGS
jgi:hypothetical protein